MSTPGLSNPPPLLVGREREQAALRDQLAAALGGRGSLVLIGGEAGIGKTALAETLCKEATEKGALVLVGRCYDLTETPPYGPWVELFGQYQPTDTMPPLPAAFAQRGTVGEVASQAALFQQVQDFLTSLATQRPLLLLLDDLHWADPASLDLLRFLARSLTALPLLIVATYRADELTRRHPLYALLPVLVREAHAERLDLRPLTENDMRELIGTRYRLGPADTSRLIASLQERAEGNPFFLGELLRTLEEGGTLHSTDDGWTVGDLTQARVPPLLRQVIDGRLARLPHDAQALLGIAAVVGHEVSLALWAETNGGDEEVLLPVIERAIEAHLLSETPDGTHVRFAHALIREAVYEGIPGIRRRGIHRSIGDFLAEQRQPDPDAVAYHFQQARDVRAAEWLGRAGDRALHAHAEPTAVERFEAALALMDLAHEGETAERAWLLTRFAFANRFTQPRQSIVHLEAAAQIAARVGDRAMAAFITKMLGTLHFFTGELARSITEMRAAMAALDGLTAEERAHLRDLLGTNSSHLRDGFILYLATAGYFREVLTLAERSVPLDRMEGSWHLGLWAAYASLGQLEHATASCERSHAIYRGIRDNRQLGLNYVSELDLMMLHYAADDLPARRHCAEQAEAAWHEASVMFPDYRPQMAWLPLLLVEGQWEELAQLLPSLDAPNATLKEQIERVAGPFARLRGDAAGAWHHVGKILPKGSATEPGSARFYTAQRMQELAVALALDAGDLPAAKVWLDAHDRWLTWSDTVLGRSQGCALWARYHRQSGDAERARQHAERAFRHASDPRQPLALLAAHRLLGELDTEAGRFDDARTHLTESLALADACQAPFERAVTLLALAEFYAATNQRVEALSLLDEVRALCMPLGAKPTLDRVDALATHISTMPAAPAAHPDGLSAREVDVLRLIATGVNNQQIADTLSLSVRTVERHITNLYGKIAARGRADATAYALRHLS